MQLVGHGLDIHHELPGLRVDSTPKSPLKIQDLLPPFDQALLGKRGFLDHPVDGHPQVVLVVEGDDVEAGEVVVSVFHIWMYEIEVGGMKGDAEIRVRRKTARLPFSGPIQLGFPACPGCGRCSTGVRGFCRKSRWLHQ